jgi:hypothetical protein
MMIRWLSQQQWEDLYQPVKQCVNISWVVSEVPDYPIGKLDSCLGASQDEGEPTDKTKEPHRSVMLQRLWSTVCCGERGHCRCVWKGMELLSDVLSGMKYVSWQKSHQFSWSCQRGPQSVCCQGAQKGLKTVMCLIQYAHHSELWPTDIATDKADSY